MKLDSKLDHVAAAELRTELLQSFEKGGSVVVNASGVVTISPICIQVLIAAQNTAASKNIDFQIEQPSDAFCRCLNDLGLDSHLSL